MFGKLGILGQGFGRLGAPGGIVANDPSPQIVLSWPSAATDLDPDFEVNYVNFLPEDGDDLTISVYTDAGLTSLYSSANNVLDAGEVAAPPVTFAGLTTLDDGTQYWAVVEMVRGVTTYTSNTVTKTMADLTAPTLSSASGVQLAQTTATLSVSTNEDNGTLYYVVTTSATPPGAAQVKAGNDHTGSAAMFAGSQAISSTGAKTATATGITVGTRYTYFMHEDAASNQSSVATDDWSQADITAPVLSSPTGTKTGSTTANLAVTSDEASGTIYWVISTSATQPSIAQIKAGNDHTGSAAAASGSDTAILSFTDAATGLTAATTYYAHFVQTDAATNDSNRATSASFTTDAGTYTANAVNFDGTNDYLTRASGLSGAVDGKVGILSFWIKINGGDGSSAIYLRDTNSRLQVSKTSGNLITIIMQSPGGSNQLSMASTNQVLVATGWVHILASWDLANTLGHLYIDDTDVRAGSPTLNNNNLDYTTADLAFGASVAGSSKTHFDAAEVYFNTVAYMDITVEANRRKFIGADGKPVSLGANGSTPTGSQPILYLANPFGSFEINLGSGGNFTVNGALTAASTSPSD